MLAPVGAGLVTGGSLIVAIGAQNAYVLRQGIARSHTATVIAVCALSDIVLIAAGVGGLGVLVTRADWVLVALTWFGIAFLLWYAAGSVRRAMHPGSLAVGEESLGPESRGTVVRRALALTWLNPHVYLDTVLLIGSIAATHEATDGRLGPWAFGIGAALASILWFAGLGVGARRLSPLLERPGAWRVLELVVAATMVLVAARLALA